MSDPFQNMLPNFQIPQCSIHNQPGIFVNPDKNDKQTPVLCVDCLNKHKKVEDQIKENQYMFQDIQNQNRRKIDLLNPFLLSIHEFLSKLTQCFNKIITLIQDQIESIKQNQTQFNDLFTQLKFIQNDTIIKRNMVQNQSFKEFNKTITEQLNNIKQKFNIDNLIQSWQQKEQNNKFQYSQVIDSIYQNNTCYTVAINQNNSIVAAANYYNIIIFEFQNEKLEEIQQLDGHNGYIQCLTFMKKSQQLISACYEGQIIIWELSNKNKWLQIQVLNEHKDAISCLQINQNEDLIISGSFDKKIKFWKLDQKQWKCNWTLQMENCVYSLSLNESNNKIIASIFNQQQIKVIEQDGNQWNETQTIKLSNETFRLCFINDNQFAVQLLQSDLLQIFNFDQNNNQYKLEQEIIFKYGESDCNLFPMQFIKSKSILINKNCQYLYIIRKQQNAEFTLIQTIDYGGRDLYGCVNDDGSYLFTWDQISKQIQVRKLEMI